VIVLQVVLVIATAIYVWGYLYGIYKVTGRILPPNPPTLALLPVLFTGYVFWALAKRKAHGRWLGLLCICTLLGMNIYRVFHPVTGSVAPRRDQALGAMSGEVIVATLLFGWWFYSLGFSEKAKAFFATRGLTMNSAEGSGSDGGTPPSQPYR
jgi:hypothetical protein